MSFSNQFTVAEYYSFGTVKLVHLI